MPSQPTREELLHHIGMVQRSLTRGGYYQGAIDGLFYGKSQKALELQETDATKGRTKTIPLQRKLTETDIREVATSNGLLSAHIHAVIEVESGGGWFTDMRKDILDLDGPGGFLDGDMPKILFEAKTFHTLTQGKYDKSHPNLSSPTWNRALYTGGQGEYVRLYRAIQLNETAALKSASWGMFQIMGNNHKVCGYPTVQLFVESMKASEVRHLEAFIEFVKNTGLMGPLRTGAWATFARGYNGPGYKKNNYAVKLKNAYTKHLTA